MTARLKRIDYIKGFGSFRDWKRDANLPDFKRYNLIYGWNGSGKTTLSRLLRSLETGLPHDIADDEAMAYRLTLVDGRKVDADSAQRLGNLLRVFNQDYVEDNLRFDEGAQASPLLVLGQERLHLADEIAAATARVQEPSSQIDDLAEARDKADAEETRVDQSVVLSETDIPLPDVLTELQDRTQLTRKSVYRIISESGRLDDFVKNPQKYIDLVTDVVSRKKQLAVVDGIKYQRVGDEKYYAQELFEEQELTGYIKNMLQDAQRSVYEAVIYDSVTERKFAEDLEVREGVKVYAKLPGWFRIPTPLGSYNPDWAVLVDTDEGERLYFVVETKSSLFEDNLRDSEWAKIKCGKAHFAALAGTTESPRHRHESQRRARVRSSLSAGVPRMVGD